MRELPPLALYVHTPWCVRKCPYCDFNSHRAPREMPTERYIDALLEDLEQELQWVQGRSLLSIFIGGGTPSLFAPEQIARLLEGVRQRVPSQPDLEITLEANPGTIERGDFRGYRAAGVSRVSLGVQSFSNDALERLGRIHTAQDVEAAVNELHAAGLTNFNLDLMYALPDQSVLLAQQDVSRAIALGPTHISHYELTIEVGTAFYRQPPRLPDTELAWEIQLASQHALATAGFVQYETSAYARGGSLCRHNLNYWRFGDYLGIGAGAHGKLTHASGEIVRTVREKQPRNYLGHSPPARVTRARVPSVELPFEFMLNALRLTAGTTADEFEARTGLPADAIAISLAAATDRGLLEVQGTQWIPTDLGRRFLNDLQALFLPQTSATNVASS